MSEALPPAAPAAPPAAAPGPAKPPIVRLKTWVNVVLVLILLASCSGASNVSDLVVQTGDGSGVASQDEVTDLCRLLGRRGGDAGRRPRRRLQCLRPSGTTTQCQDAARATSTP